MLGTYLGFSQSEIREIEEDYHSTYRRRMEMLDKWLRKEVNPSWMKIVTALKKMSELNLADRLTKKYLSVSSPECDDEGSSVHPHHQQQQQQQQQKEQSEAVPTTTTSKKLYNMADITLHIDFDLIFLVSGKPLNVNNAFKVVISCSQMWKKLGVMLDVEISDLAKIESARKDHDDSMIDMLDVWLKQDSNQTWNQLADALEQIREPKLAQLARQNQ